MKPALLLFSCIVFQATAHACSFERRTDEQLVAQSKVIFRARITEVRLATMPNPDKPSVQLEVVEGKFELKEILKGTPPISGFVRDMPFGPGNCNLPLLPGVEYIFFPEENDFVWTPSGSFGFINSEGTAVQPRLVTLRSLVAGTK